MARFRRKDKTQVNGHGQTLGYATWMGGPTLTYVGSAVCPWGKANFFATAEPDVTNSTFAVCGYVNAFNKKIYGRIVARSWDFKAEVPFDEVLYVFIPTKNDHP